MKTTLYVLIGYPFDVDDDPTICGICDDLQIAERFVKVAKSSGSFYSVFISGYTLNELIDL